MERTMRVFPGCMGAASLCMDLFGVDRVDAGRSGTPVWVMEVTDDEFQAAKKLLHTYGLNVAWEDECDGFRVEHFNS